MWKIIHQKVGVTLEDLNINKNKGKTRAKHKHRLHEHPANGDLRKFSFVNNTIRDWNSLPATCAEADSPITLKSQLALLD